MIIQFSGGERGIRTLDTLVAYTHFPGVRLQPLGHLSLNQAAKYKKIGYTKKVIVTKNRNFLLKHSIENLYTDTYG